MSAVQALDPLRFPLHGSRLIEASAGTGKTYTIAALYVRLVLGHGGEAGFSRELLPPEILVVTFTEAATQELRERIRRRLTEAAQHFRRQLERPDPFLAALREDYPAEAWPGCAYRLEAAAEWMDEAAVSTIHAWCYRMLREHAFDSGSLFTQNLEADQSELYLEAVRDYWRRYYYALDAQDLALIYQRWPSPQALAGEIRGLLGHVDGAVLEREPAELIEQIEGERRTRLAELKAPWAAWADELEVLLEDGRSAGQLSGKTHRADWCAGWLRKLRAWAAESEQDRLDLGKGWERLTAEGLAEAWKGDEPPAHPCLEAMAVLRDQLAGLPEVLPALQRHAAAWVERRFAAEQRQRAQLGFDDLLRRLDAALAGRNGERLAEVIRRQFPLALIDEFQDTDPVQYRIFRRIYRIEDNHPEQGLFLIGDPKQAIYAFRGADIYTYLAARRATTGRHYTLSRNFRSTAAAVAAVNRVFGHAEARARSGAFMFRSADDDPLPFAAVEAQGRRERLTLAGIEQPALTCWHVAGGTLKKDDYLTALAEGCASHVVRLLNDTDCGFDDGAALTRLRPADMAVLVRNGTEAQAIRDALAARGVRSVYLSDKESVFACEEAQDLLRWLRACAEPEADRALRAALATATLGLDWRELERLNADELHWEAQVMRFRGYRQLWRKQGVLPMLRRLLHDFAVPERLLAAPRGERRLTDLLHLAELMQQAAGELDGEQALIRHLAEQLNPERCVEEQVIRLESDEALVKVVTIHKSKGLEYPLVFLPFICTFRATAKTDLPLRYHDPSGELVLGLEASEEALERADRERLAEDLRLLYVALTRARHACWLGVAPLRVGNSKDCVLHRSALGYVLGAGRPIAADELSARLDELCAGTDAIAVAPVPEPDDTRFDDPAAEAPMGAARRPARPAREHWWIASYSALQIGAEAETDGLAPAPDTALEDVFTEAAGEDPAPAPPRRLAGVDLHGFPRGPNPGTFLHGLLEWAAREGFDRVVAEPERLRQMVHQRCAQRRLELHAEPLYQWLRHLLETPLALPGARPVALAELSRYQPELEFWFATHRVDAQVLDQRVRRATLGGAARPAVLSAELNGMLKGFIDLVFEHQGRYYVVDYKSNWLGETDAAYTAAAMRETVLAKRYDLQYVLYTLALHRLLAVRLPGYDYDSHMGGAAYLFLRGSRAPGQGLHWERPPRALIEELDRMFRAQPVPRPQQEEPA